MAVQDLAGQFVVTVGENGGFDYDNGPNDSLNWEPAGVDFRCDAFNNYPQAPIDGRIVRQLK